MFCDVNLAVISSLHAMPCPLLACTHSETKERMRELNEFDKELRTQVSPHDSGNVDTLTPILTVTDSGGGGTNTELDRRALRGHG